VLLTTHYMAEADELCDRIAIVDRGRILAIGTPSELKRRVQGESVFRLELNRLDGGPATLAALPGVVSAVAAAEAATGGPARQTAVVNLVLHDDAALSGVVEALGGIGSRIVALQKSEPTLEDVFVELVGRGLEEEEAAPARPARTTTAIGSEPGSPPARPDTSHEAGDLEEDEPH
jgi:ABC-2 type transport system ATP-binding protein